MVRVMKEVTYERDKLKVIDWCRLGRRLQWLKRLPEGKFERKAEVIHMMKC